MFKVRFIFYLFSFFCLFVSLVPSSAKSKRDINVYCTSNLDSTGVCTDEKTQSSFDCIIIPGQIIECKDKDAIEYECVLISQVTPTQAQFSCSELSSSNTQSTNESSEALPNDLSNDFQNAF